MNTRFEPVVVMGSSQPLGGSLPNSAMKGSLLKSMKYLYPTSEPGTSVSGMAASKKFSSMRWSRHLLGSLQPHPLKSPRTCSVSPRLRLKMPISSSGVRSTEKTTVCVTGCSLTGEESSK